MVNIINIIPFIHILIINMIKSDIINNPIQTFNQSNPLDFYLSFANYSARTIYAFNEIKITQEIDTIKFNDSSYIYSQNLFRCSSQVNTYLFADYKLYQTFENKNGIISAHLYNKYLIIVFILVILKKGNLMVPRIKKDINVVSMLMRLYYME